MTELEIGDAILIIIVEAARRFAPDATAQIKAFCETEIAAILKRIVTPTVPATPAAIAPDFMPMLDEERAALYAEADRATAWSEHERITEKEIDP